MSLTYDRTVEIRNTHPGIWYVRIVLLKDGVEEGQFFKFKQESQPSDQQINDVVNEWISLQT